MANEFVPEMHDIGKMVDNDAVVAAGFQFAKPGKDLSGHEFDWIDWDNAAFANLRTNSNYRTVRYHGKRYRELPERSSPDLKFRKQILLTNLADHYGSTTSRAVAEGNEEIEGEFKALRGIVTPKRQRKILWNERAATTPVLVTKPDELLGLIQSLAAPDLSSTKFLETWGSWLELLPEDASAPRNVTSLMTHMALVGRIYRFLVKNYADAFEDDRILYLDKNQQVRSAEDAEGNARVTPPIEPKWLMTLVTCRLKIPQHPVRVGDLNVFRRQEQVLQKIREENKNQLLFYTNDTLWLVLPSTKQVDVEKEIAKILSPLYEPGFWAESRSLPDINMRARETEVRRLRWHDDKAIQNDPQVQERTLYDESKLEEEFNPPLCSICQIRQATKEWPKDSEDKWVQKRNDTPEAMCEVCLKIRDVPVRDRFKQLARWHPDDVEKKAGQSEEEFEAEVEKMRNVKTAWVKLTLDYDALIDYLGKSYNAYLDSLRVRVPAGNAPALDAIEIARNDFNPLALMADFTEDYRRLTQAIDARLRKDDWQFESIREKDFRDFYVVRVENGADVLRFLQLYGEALLEYFPDALENCPVRIAVNVSLTKYPFYEHWRWISEPNSAVNLQMPGIARVEIGASEFLEFLTRLNLSDPRGELRLTKTYLEKLRATEARTGRSRALLTAVLLADIEAKRIPRALQPFIELYQQKQITIQDILDWYKITTWGRER